MRKQRITNASNDSATTPYTTEQQPQQQQRKARPLRERCCHAGGIPAGNVAPGRFALLANACDPVAVAASLFMAPLFLIKLARRGFTLAHGILKYLLLLAKKYLTSVAIYEDKQNTMTFRELLALLFISIYNFLKKNNFLSLRAFINPFSI